ncbi:TetR/AcrR family transcriptional regulator [Virgibacillus flavescens]|uniref:TetR/AcrR family transcriptional regulator n=1 Tax=Virgibacillus flavescens TaxID=1611422 RepID=UPI003D341140
MDGHTRRASLKKKAIEDAAFQLLNEGGVKELKIRDIAKHAGTSPASIYNYYGSKENLIVETMKAFYETEYQKLKHLVEKDDEFIDPLHTYFLQKPKNTNLLRQDIMEEMLKENSELNNLVKEYQKRTAPLFLEWIEKGREQGYIKEGITNEMVLTYYQLMANSIEQLYRNSPPEQDREKNHKGIIEMFFYGFIDGKNR